MGVTFSREFREYFNTMLGYAFVAAFLFLAGLFFAMNNINAQNADFNTTLNDCVYVFMITAPLLTMKLYAEEKKTKRDQLLVTSMTPISQIIVGKFLAALAVYGVALACTIIYPVILALYGTITVPLIINGYIGLFLLGMAFIAIGVFASSITENQLTAAIVTYGILLLLLGVEVLISQVHIKAVVAIAQWLSLFKRFETFLYGTFSIASLVYYLCFTCVFVILSIVVINSRRIK